MLHAVIWHVKMEGHSMAQPVHVTVQMATVEMPVKVSAHNYVMILGNVLWKGVMHLLAAKCVHCPSGWWWSIDEHGFSRSLELIVFGDAW